MSFPESGYELVENFLDAEQLRQFKQELDVGELPKSRGGIRNAEVRFECVEAFVTAGVMKARAEACLDGTVGFVRAILFNKTASNNWLVAWHQDKTVTVTKKIDEPGWGPWSEKDGVLHVQPPVAVLNNMVTFRVHIDHSSKENGCLSVIPGSHKLGVLSRSEILECVRTQRAVRCQASAGSVLVMRPNLIHASSKGLVPSQRRVLHIEYSSYKLPTGVRWARSA